MQFAYYWGLSYICKVKVNLVKWTNILSQVEADKDMKKAFIKFYYKLKEVEWKKPNDVVTPNVRTING